MGKINSIIKGKVGEREFANEMKDRGFDSRRGQQHKGGPDAPDVVGLPRIHAEVKRCERLQLYKAMEQAIEESGEGETPVVFHRQNKQKWLAIMDLDAFVSFYLMWLNALDKQKD